MNEAAFKVERIGEAVSMIRLRLRRVLQDGSSSLREINCGSSCSVVLLRHLGQTSVAWSRKGRRMEAERPPQATTPQRPPSRRGSELVGRGLGHFPQLQSFCDIPVLFASENSAPSRLCGRLYRGVLVGL
jgi:hypothetical protein